MTRRDRLQAAVLVAALVMVLPDRARADAEGDVDGGVRLAIGDTFGHSDYGHAIATRNGVAIGLMADISGGFIPLGPVKLGFNVGVDALGGPMWGSDWALPATFLMLVRGEAGVSLHFRRVPLAIRGGWQVNADNAFWEFSNRGWFWSGYFLRARHEVSKQLGVELGYSTGEIHAVTAAAYVPITREISGGGKVRVGFEFRRYWMPDAQTSGTHLRTSIGMDF